MVRYSVSNESMGTSHCVLYNITYIRSNYLHLYPLPMFRYIILQYLKKNYMQPYCSGSVFLGLLPAGKYRNKTL